MAQWAMLCIAAGFTSWLAYLWVASMPVIGVHDYAALIADLQSQTSAQRWLPQAEVWAPLGWIGWALLVWPGRLAPRLLSVSVVTVGLCSLGFAVTVADAEFGTLRWLWVTWPFSSILNLGWSAAGPGGGYGVDALGFMVIGIISGWGALRLRGWRPVRATIGAALGVCVTILAFELWLTMWSGGYWLTAQVTEAEIKYGLAWFSNLDLGIMAALGSCVFAATLKLTGRRQN